MKYLFELFPFSHFHVFTFHFHKSAKDKSEKLPDLELTQKFKSVWNPRLIDEPERNFVDSKQLFEAAELGQDATLLTANPEGNQNTTLGMESMGAASGMGGMGGGGARGGSFSPNASPYHNPESPLAEGEPYAVELDLLYPNEPPDRRPSRPGTPKGPHPDKRGSWN